MATIAQLLGQNPAGSYTQHPLLPPGRIGLELELEGIEGGEWPNVKGWRKETDGSLRDGLEYVFDGAAGGSQAVSRIQSMGQMLRNNPMNNSFRCSTHIHMDVRDMEFAELEKLVAAYCMFEGVMFDHCSMERRFSNFCTPFFLNTYLGRQFVRTLGNPRYTEVQRFSTFGNWPKYSALNLKPAMSYGSVEFRGSHALDNEADILALAQRMLHLKRVTDEGRGVALLPFIEALRMRPIEDVFPTGLMAGYMPDERLMDKGYSTAIDIATGSTRLATGYDQIPEPSAVGPRRTEGHPDHMVSVNRALLDSYNIYVNDGGQLRLSKLIKLTKALRRLSGVTPPSIWQLIQNPAGWSHGEASSALVWWCSRLNVTHAEIGL